LAYTIDLTNEGDTTKSKASDTLSSPTTEVKNDAKFDQTVVRTNQAAGAGMKTDGNKSPNHNEPADDGKMEGAGWFGAIPVVLVVGGIAYFVYTKCIKSQAQMPNIPNPFQSNAPEPGFIPGFPSNDPFRANFPSAPSAPGGYPPAPVPQQPPMYPQLPPQQPAGWPTGPEASGGYNPAPPLEQPTVTYTSVPTHDIGSPTHAGNENEMRKASGFGGTSRR